MRPRTSQPNFNCKQTRSVTIRIGVRKTTAGLSLPGGESMRLSLVVGDRHGGKDPMVLTASARESRAKLSMSREPLRSALLAISGVGHAQATRGGVVR